MRPFNALLAALLLFAGMGMFAVGNSAQQSGSGADQALPPQQVPNQNQDQDQDAADTAAQSGAATPLEDYEASEQISEDLSVAFPVDI